MFIVYIDHIERLDFFLRFDFDKKKVTLITARLSIYILAKIKKKGEDINVILIRNNPNSNPIVNDVIRFSRDVIAGFVTPNDATSFAKSICFELTNILETEVVEAVLLWNGTDIAERVIAKLAIEKKINTIFFEISNLPGKIFIDPLGTNADSLLAKSQSLYWLKNLPDNNKKEYGLFLTEYKKIKSGEYKPPQTKKNSAINMFFLIDYLSYKLKISPRTQSIFILEKIQRVCSRLFISRKNPPNSFMADLSGSYVFLPLQVSNDSQVLLNSEVNNIGAINFAVDYCLKNKKELLVKIHPAEFNRDLINEYSSLSIKHNFKLVTNNTIEIIKRADCVITINSTVGLESMMFNIPTIFLGRTFYSKLKGPKLEYYIQRYLYDAEYFCGETIDFTKLLEHYANIVELSKRLKVL